MRRRLLATCRWHVATAGLFRRKATPPSSTTSPQAPYRLRRLFFKSHRALILLRLLSKPQPLCWVVVWPPFGRRFFCKLHIACDDFFVKSSCAHYAAPPFRIGPATLGSDSGPPSGRFWLPFFQKTSLTHSVAPSFQTEPAGPLRTFREVKSRYRTNVLYLLLAYSIPYVLSTS